MASSYYQYYQTHLQNPTPTPTPGAVGIDPQFAQVSSAPYASAPPVFSNYPQSDYGNYSSPSSAYQPYSQDPEHFPTSYAPNPSPTPASQPPHQPYTFPHLDSSYYPYDQNQAGGVNYGHSHANPNYDSSSPYSSAASYGSLSPAVPKYENSFGNNSRHDDEGVYGAGVYKYNGGKVESYGGRGSRSESRNEVMFDDYGRPINIPNTKGQNRSGNLPKIVKATPKVEEQSDAKGTVQKFRVKLLSEGVGQTDSDVLCQIGLDGIRVLDPATSRILKIYPLETVTRWDVLDSYIFAFWTKTSIDVEPRRIRLKSNSYTTNNILDAVTAASIQVKEMGGTNKPLDPSKEIEQPGEKKKGLIDWRILMKPGTEEKDHWVPDEAVTKCISCATAFNAFVRKHHCRNCGDIFCDKCTQGRIALTADENAQPVRVCDQCMAEVTQRLSNAKEAAARVTEVQSHEELVRKLREEMEKNRKGSTGITSNTSGKRMREVACPTCTVHLQVEVPAVGFETIECSVCQHPFRIDAC